MKVYVDVAGVPGTGKTATVNRALREVVKTLPAFKLIEINGMKLAKPQDVYSLFVKKLTGKTCE